MSKTATLITTIVATGEKKITKGIDYNMLVAWVERTRKESADNILTFEIAEE